MKLKHILCILLAAGTASAQTFKHEPNGRGQKVSVEGANGSSTASAGSPEAGADSSSASTAPEEGKKSGYTASSSYAMHNGKWVKVTRVPGRYGEDMVTVSSNEGGKEKTEEMTYSAYVRKYMGGKDAKKARQAPPGDGEKKPALPPKVPAAPLPPKTSEPPAPDKTKASQPQTKPSTTNRATE